MFLNSSKVALLHSRHYLQRDIAEAMESICRALQFRVGASSRVLLKPNLLTGRSPNHLACTGAEFVAAAAEWFLSQGGVVSVGDSPAFGSARGVMRVTGIERALAGMGVEQVNFEDAVPIRLAGGVQVKVARAALECDMLVNLPRIKAHGQFYMTMAVKNYFGTVVGFQKPSWHLRYGDREDRFAANLVDLLAQFPPGLTLVDGIVAMHCTGPVSGQPFPLGLVAGSVNPVAVDTALLKLLGLDMHKSAVWRECRRRGLMGADPDTIDFCLSHPSEFKVDGFRAPEILNPVSFNPLRILQSGCRRIAARLKESS